ncbi:hypothetical protein T02_5009 [Trichinella nativa]|uniref:Uncharacterized protein n=1 Tax=Trichinella nativa TaxID=6335 RepID=A0A0V1KT55_9BILA|nr:hypothetical protein T02_5009 [Trichinella nativa]
MRSNFSGKNQNCTFGSQRIARLVSCEADKKAIVWFRYTAVVNTCAVLCVIWEDFLHGTLKNLLYSIYFTTKRKWWKYRDEEMKHTLSKRASLTLKFWMLWNEVCLYQAQSITGVIGLDSFATFVVSSISSKLSSSFVSFFLNDILNFCKDLQTLEDALTFFGQSFLFTMKLLFCRISFGQMRRQIIDLVVGKRIVSISSDLWYVEESRNTKELIMHWYYVAMMQRIKNNNMFVLEFGLRWLSTQSKAYLNLTSTYTINLARDTGMRRHSYRIGIPGEFHINYVLRESYYNECLTIKNSLHCGILDSSSSAWSISTDVPKLHCNHIGTLDAIASPAAPTKILTVDQLEAFNAAKSALPTPLCYTTPPDSQVHALMVGASDHVIRTLIHGNRWHFGSRPTLRICLPSPLRMSTFRSVHGLSHPGIRTTKRLMMEMGPGTLP